MATRDPEGCNRCQKKLNPKKVVWLELDQRTNTYTDEPVPEEHSQGGFKFGPDCAEIEKGLHRKARERISKAAAALGAAGGSKRSKAKAASSRANGKLGGRPRKQK